MACFVLEYELCFDHHHHNDHLISKEIELKFGMRPGRSTMNDGDVGVRLKGCMRPLANCIDPKPSCSELLIFGVLSNIACLAS